MRLLARPPSSLGALLCCAPLALAAETPAPDVAADDGPRTETLSYQALSSWDLVLPAERWAPVGDAIELAGLRFAVERDGPLGLMVDTDADGRLDSKVKGVRGFQKLRAKDAAGKLVTYAVRFAWDAPYERWTWSAGGVMKGKVEGTLIQVVDQNGDGDYDDYGRDALVIGSGEAATLLSEVVNLDGALYHFAISADGATVTYRPYAGPTGTLDLASRHSSRGKLVAAIVSSRGGEMHFNAARDKKPLLVPAGTYELTSGYCVRAGESVRMRGGKMAPVRVDAGADVVVEWGGPIVAEFEYDVHETIVTVAPNVAFYGTAGEEYHTFQPDAKSPKILIADANTGKLLDSGRFGGC